MKIYVAPEMEIRLFEREDTIACSGGNSGIQNGGSDDQGGFGNLVG